MQTQAKTHKTGNNQKSKQITTTSKHIQRTKTTNQAMQKQKRRQTKETTSKHKTSKPTQKDNKKNGHHIKRQQTYITQTRQQHTKKPTHTTNKYTI